jgi:hypothetical protein
MFQLFHFVREKSDSLIIIVQIISIILGWIL